MNKDAFFVGFIKAMLFEGTDDNGDPIEDTYGVDDIDETVLKRLLKECDAFCELAGDLVPEDRSGEAGQDFLFTRNGAGAGFWDGDWGEDLGDTLTAMSKSFKEVEVYVGDDEIIYVEGMEP